MAVLLPTTTTSKTWKTHIAPDAQHLFLIVPRANWNAAGRAREKPFLRVKGRLAAFFGDPRRELDVLSLHLFGYGQVALPIAASPGLGSSEVIGAGSPHPQHQDDQFCDARLQTNRRQRASTGLWPGVIHSGRPFSREPIDHCLSEPVDHLRAEP